MKYKEEYLATSDRPKFLELFERNYPELSIRTGMRHYSRLKKQIGNMPTKIFKKLGEPTIEPVETKEECKYEPHEKKEPAKMKLMNFDDMKEYGKLSKKNLKINGFTPQEIRWLEDNRDWTQNTTATVGNRLKINPADMYEDISKVSKSSGEAKLKEEISIDDGNTFKENNLLCDTHDNLLNESIFSSDELFEIEKLADHYAGLITSRLAEFIQQYNLTPKGKEFLKEVTEQSIKSYTMFRDISAKCGKIRKK